MNPVAVIGAGITGLTAAYYLQRKGVPVTLYESGSRPGGVIQSVRRDGFLAEFGPNTILETAPGISQLIRDAGLEKRRLYTEPQANARYLVCRGKPVAMPSSVLGFLTTSLFSAKAKLSLLREPFIPRRRDGKEESVAEFVIRRLGREFLDRAIDPLVAGIYAGDSEKLSVPFAFPKLAQLEARYGSLIKGQLFGARERKKSAEISKDRAPKFSFDEGLQVLTDTLAASVGSNLRLGVSVNRLSRIESGWRLNLRRDQEDSAADHSAVVYAGTAYNLAKLAIEAMQPVDVAPFAEIRHPPVASIVFGFKREAVAHACQGFGLLVPKIEGLKILGTIFSSSLFRNRAPKGHLTLTTYMGGERYPEVASLSHEKIMELALHDLRVLLGVSGQPVFRHIAFYPRAIPQYNVGYGRYRDFMVEIERRAPGLFLAGHYRDGVSLSDSILSGGNVAERAGKFYETTKPGTIEACKAA